jgi:hypothetical protein
MMIWIEGWLLEGIRMALGTVHRYTRHGRIYASHARRNRYQETFL